jgi:hypothetical protein
MNNPDLTATVFVDSTQMYYVEVSFVDSDVGVEVPIFTLWTSEYYRCVAWIR